jgi:hypothetical protein
MQHSAAVAGARDHRARRRWHVGVGGAQVVEPKGARDTVRYSLRKEHVLELRERKSAEWLKCRERDDNALPGIGIAIHSGWQIAAEIWRGCFLVGAAFEPDLWQRRRRDRCRAVYETDDIGIAAQIAGLKSRQGNEKCPAPAGHGPPLHQAAVVSCEMVVGQNRQLPAIR